MYLKCVELIAVIRNSCIDWPRIYVTDQIARWLGIPSINYHKCIVFSAKGGTRVYVNGTTTAT